MERNGQVNFAAAAIAALIFIICLAIYGQIWGAQNYNMLGTSSVQLMAIIPLVLVATVIIGVVITAMKMAQ